MHQLRTTESLSGRCSRSTGTFQGMDIHVFRHCWVLSAELRHPAGVQAYRALSARAWCAWDGVKMGHRLVGLAVVSLILPFLVPVGVIGPAQATGGTPVIFAVSPASGSIDGGTSVTITGENLTGATAVTFGATAATSFTVDSDTQISAVTPAKAAGAVDVAVTTPGGTANAVAFYTYRTFSRTFATPGFYLCAVGGSGPQPVAFTVKGARGGQGGRGPLGGFGANISGSFEIPGGSDLYFIVGANGLAGNSAVPPGATSPASAYGTGAGGGGYSAIALSLTDDPVVIAGGGGGAAWGIEGGNADPDPALSAGAGDGGDDGDRGSAGGTLNTAGTGGDDGGGNGGIAGSAGSDASGSGGAGGGGGFGADGGIGSAEGYPSDGAWSPEPGAYGGGGGGGYDGGGGGGGWAGGGGGGGAGGSTGGGGGGGSSLLRTTPLPTGVTDFAVTGTPTADSTAGSVFVEAANEFTCGVAITYQGNGNTGGTVPSDGTYYADGSTAVAKAGTGLVKGANGFVGWSTSQFSSVVTYAAGAAIPVSTTPITLWAVYGPTVTFDANGGSGSMPSQSSLVAANLTSNTFVRSGFTFAGWNTADDGTGTPYANGASFPFTSSTTLFAQWTAAPPAPTPDPNPAPGPVTPQPTPTPTPTPSQTTTPPRLDPITSGQNPNLPVGGVPLGDSVLLVNGQPAPVTVRPDAPRNATALDIAGPGFTMQLAGRTTNNRPLGLTPDGALILEQDRTAFTQGTGFQANSQVYLYLLSTPQFLGTVATDASGAFQGSVPLPVDIPAGRHTLQANGLTADGAVRSLSLGVQVQQPSTRATVRRANTTVYFAALSPRLDATAKRSLDALVKGRKKAVTRIVVNGFVQGNDTTANDRSLSLARARAVGSYLKSQGVTGTVVTRAEGVATETGAAGRKAGVTITYRR